MTVDAGLIDLDVAAFTRLLDEDTPEALAQAAALYRGDLLAGMSVTEEPWEAWLRESESGCASRPATAWPGCSRTSGRPSHLEAAIRTASQLLTLDPLQEPVHRTLMRLHAQLGQRGAALRQYQHCVSVLRSELGVEPEAETRQLYQEILQQRTAAAPLAGGRGAAAADDRRVAQGAGDPPGRDAADRSRRRDGPATRRRSTGPPGGAAASSPSSAKRGWARAAWSRS